MVQSGTETRERDSEKRKENNLLKKGNFPFVPNIRFLGGELLFQVKYPLIQTFVIEVFDSLFFQ